MENNSKTSKFRKYGTRGLVGTALMVVAAASFAQSTGVDVSAATGSLAQVKTAVGEIGPNMLAAVGAGIVFKWVLAFII
ncbi:major capsid protein [Pseudoxanthomonas winnipegensis]|uniref:major capsid protein n=1 Tax=Pseudoxanthomonas winnipegensis TaxID=2480810 RepID=UPI00102D97A0|nr:major capsid protein [Pseudoxanthomonas winnipegensis]TAA08849.1 hypothetical protein EA659_13440 [Pseudoxanthomonas winnipegensis]TAH71797.1 hypothetical protein EA657_11785 [Pseudoxanthomonas winnipegensis]